jgi:hypothetical protein
MGAEFFEVFDARSEKQKESGWPPLPLVPQASMLGVSRKPPDVCWVSGRHIAPFECT